MTPAAREAARIRQQRKYHRDAARRVARAEAAARRLEQAANAAEQLAPVAQRTAIYSATGDLLHGPRVAIRNGRPMRFLAADGLTLNQRRAAARLQADYDEVGHGIGAGVMDPTRSHIHRGAWTAPPGQDALIRQLEARQRLEAALTYLGAFTPLVRRVVCDSVPLSVWGKETGKSAETAHAWLRAALDRLVAFYGAEPREQPRRPEIRTLGPARASYEV